MSLGPLSADLIPAIREWLHANKLTSLGQITAKILGEIADHVEEHREALRNKAKERKKADRKAREAFIPPTATDVEIYSTEIGWPMNGVGWLAHYEKKGWEIGKGTKMKDWKAGVRYWKAQGIQCGKPVTKANNYLGKPAPLGWRVWVDDNLPDCAYAKGNEKATVPWELIDPTAQKAICDQMPKQTSYQP